MEILKVDPIGNCKQLETCAEHYLKGGYRTTVEAGYIGVGRPGEEVVAYIDLRTTYEDFMEGIKKRYKGNVIRDARKAWDKLGCFSHRFEMANFIPDMHEINHSKEIRCGRPMEPNYRRSIEEMGGAPTEFKKFTHAECPAHWRYLWGIFKPEVGYKQGDLIVDKKLLGYISLYRSGNYVQYSMLLGHGSYLKYGIMYYLHFKIVDWLINNSWPEAEDIDFLWYCNWGGGPGLRLWKKKAGFKEGRLMGEWHSCMS